MTNDLITLVEILKRYDVTNNSNLGSDNIQNQYDEYDSLSYDNVTTSSFSNIISSSLKYDGNLQDRTIVTSDIVTSDDDNSLTFDELVSIATILCKNRPLLGNNHGLYTAYDAIFNASCDLCKLSGRLTNTNVTIDDCGYGYICAKRDKLGNCLLCKKVRPLENVTQSVTVQKPVMSVNTLMSDNTVMRNNVVMNDGRVMGKKRVTKRKSCKCEQQ